MGERLKLNSVSGNVVSFDTDLEKKLGSLKIGIEPVQEGSGDPSPDNVRPITGWTGANVVRRGKNLFDKNGSNILNASLDTAQVQTSSLSKTIFVRVKENTRYAISKIISARFVLAFSNINDAPTVGTPITNYYTNAASSTTRYVTTENDTKWLLAWVYASNYDTVTLDTILESIQIEEVGNSTATSYEPYRGNTYSIDWTSNAGTVYGGELDLAKGILSVNWIKINASDITWTHSSSYPDGVFQGRLPYARATKEINVISDVYKGVSHTYVVANMPNQTIKGNQNAVYNYNIYVRDDRYTTLEEFNNNLNANIVYELETPQTYSLTPTEISTLLGTNTLYADCGPIQEASYFSRDYVPVASDTGLITITDGVEAPIDSLKIHFEPIQEGSGDPSPENVRPISGWTGTNAIRCGKNLFDEVNARITTRYFRIIDNLNVWEYSTGSGSYTFKCKPNQTYTISCNNPDITIFRVGYINVNPDELTQLESPVIYSPVRKVASGVTTITTGADAKVILIQINASIISTRNTQMQLELGSTATTYEPYTGQTYPITFPSEAGTVYGGYVDVAKGALTVDRAIKTYIGDENWISYNGYNGFSIYNNDMKSGTRQAGISNYLKNDKGTHNKYGIWFGVSNILIYVIEVADLLPEYTVEAWKTYLSEHPLQVVYPLAEPLTYSLTPIQLSTIKGLNNIYSDANGAIEMSYYSPVKENMIATRRSVVASAPHIETASGGIASFETNMAAKLKNLTVNIEPVQDLHGQDAPYPPGGGKNLYDKDSDYYGQGVFWNSSLGTLSNSDDYYASPKIPIKPNTQYTRNAGANADLYFDINGEFIKTEYSGTTFTTPENAYFVAFNIGNSTNHDTIQLEQGSTASAWTPYSNICPISGWTGATIHTCNANLWDNAWFATENNPMTLITDTTDNFYGYYGGYIARWQKNYSLNSGGEIGVTKNMGRLRITATFGTPSTTSQSFKIIVAYDNGTTGTTSNNTVPAGESMTVTFVTAINKNCVGFGLITNAGVNTYGYIKDVTVTQYIDEENYIPSENNVYPVTFPTEAGTVYGGTLDVTTGELTITWGEIDLSKLVWTYNTSLIPNVPIFVTGNVPSRKIGSMNMLCSVYKSYSGLRQNIPDKAVTSYNATNSSAIVIRDDAYSDVTSFRNAITGVSFVCELATPITYQLTPTEIQTLLGANNIYADTGNTNLTYWKH